MRRQKRIRGNLPSKTCIFSSRKTLAPLASGLVPRPLLRGLGIAKAIVRPAVVSRRVIFTQLDNVTPLTVGFPIQ